MSGARNELEALDAYVLGELPDDEAEALEETLFDAAASGEDDAARFLDRVARDGAQLVAHGTFHMGVTREQVAALRARSDVDVQVFDLGEPGGTRDIAAKREGDFIVTILRVGLREHSRVDVETEIPHAGVRKTIRDVLVDPDDGHIYGLCEQDLALLGFSAGHAITRVIAIRDGKRETVAVYETTSRVE